MLRFAYQKLLSYNILLGGLNHLTLTINGWTINTDLVKREKWHPFHYLQTVWTTCTVDNSKHNSCVALNWTYRNLCIHFCQALSPMTEWLSKTQLLCDLELSIPEPMLPLLPIIVSNDRMTRRSRIRYICILWHMFRTRKVDYDWWKAGWKFDKACQFKTGLPKKQK